MAAFGFTASEHRRRARGARLGYKTQAKMFRKRMADGDCTAALELLVGTAEHAVNMVENAKGARGHLKFVRTRGSGRRVNKMLQQFRRKCVISPRY